MIAEDKTGTGRIIMRENKSIRKWLLFGVITFVVILLLELCVVRIVDYSQEKDSLWLNITQRMLDDMVSEEVDMLNCSEIIGREWTETEEQEQRNLKTQSGLITYNNLGVAEDFMLSDGEWFLDEDLICINLRKRTEEGILYNGYFRVENDEILSTYREYWKDAFYSYDKNTQEMLERYRYYQLVFESFYLDDKQLIPEKVSIYKVENIPPKGADSTYIDVTDFTLMKTMEFEVQNTDGLKHYEIAEPVDQYNVTDIVYDYTCDGVEDYSVLRDCTLNGKAFSLGERKALLEDCLNENYALKKRDLIGFSNYYYHKGVKNSSLLGGEVTVIACEQNILYRSYLYIWKFVLVVMIANIVVTAFITVIAAQVHKYKIIKHNK